MSTLHDINGVEIGRVYFKASFPGPGLPIRMDDPKKYIFSFMGDASRLKEQGDYRVNFDDGRTVQVRISQTSQIDGEWLLTCEVEN